MAKQRNAVQEHWFRLYCLVAYIVGCVLYMVFILGGPFLLFRLSRPAHLIALALYYVFSALFAIFMALHVSRYEREDSDEECPTES